ncbi:MAG: ATP-binding protein [Candidatus Dadabacteria bacterium]|nr:ATP-binding protein [Candidatus Dadabacteria bacterium]MDE0663265.1 ATP-binding protein [Candidatus Dadabacteria bacterium]
MFSVSEQEILRRLRTDSLWWENRNDVRWKDSPKRIYFTPFFELIYEKKINRAVVLMGPRRVGKTVMVHQAVAELIRKRVDPKRILYVPLDNPLYSGLSLEKIFLIFTELNSIAQDESGYLFFDEIQYLSDWERHLKSLVDSYPQHRFIATGSAAAVLKLKSDESGAGRFTDFILPPLTFYEYVKFSDKEKRFFVQGEEVPYIPPSQIGLLLEKIEDLNEEFINYINFGGYPEAVFLEEVRENPGRFIRNDIIEKVLLRDLPSLYGIRDIPELNRLFVTLAHNTGQEINLSGLSQDSSVAKTTILKYLEYLEAAFLIKRVSRIDRNARKFKREHKFKVYITNASMYPALFGALEEDNKTILGKLAETAFFSNSFHLPEHSQKSYYARWKNGEVDQVDMGATGITVAVEIKWSDRPLEDSSEIKGLLDFAEENKLFDPSCLCCCTLTKQDVRHYGNKEIVFIPTSIYCFLLGQSLNSSEFREDLLKSAVQRK